MKKLTPQQERFVQEYMVDLNARGAAIRAGYSVKSARIRGGVLLSKPNVQLAVQRAKEARAKATGLTADRVLAEISLVAFSDLANHLEIKDDGIVRVKEFEKMPGDTRRALESMTDTRDKGGAGKLGIKMHDKMEALVMLAKHLGICKDTIRLTGADGGPVQNTLTVRVVKTKGE